MENPRLVMPKTFLQLHHSFSSSFWKINLSQRWFQNITLWCQKKAFCCWVCLSTAKKASWGPCKHPVWLRKVLFKTSRTHTEVKLHLLQDCINANTRNWAKALHVQIRDHFPGKTSRSTKLSHWDETRHFLIPRSMRYQPSSIGSFLKISVNVFVLEWHYKHSHSFSKYVSLEFITPIH